MSVFMVVVPFTLPRSVLGEVLQKKWGNSYNGNHDADRNAAEPQALH